MLKMKYCCWLGNETAINILQNNGLAEKMIKIGL